VGYSRSAVDGGCFLTLVGGDVGATLACDLMSERNAKNDGLPRIGWREWVGLSALGVDRVHAKVDTGARSSALHASEIEYFERQGRAMVRFAIHPDSSGGRIVRTEAPLLDRRRVKNSAGTSTIRPVIATDVAFRDACFTIELTLVPRDSMSFRMLVGREAVRGRFVVDPGRSYLASVPRGATRRGSQRRAAERIETGKPDSLASASGVRDPGGACSSGEDRRRRRTLG
jgi:hypothetical protein